MALDKLVSELPDSFERGSFGTVYGGFTPDTRKTFNRGYTELYIDGKRGKWACMDAAKSMGEEVGTVASLNHDKSSLTVRFASREIVLANGDGFSFVARDGSVAGFRGDVCSGTSIKCKSTPSLYVGAKIYRSLNAVFEKELERQACTRRISADVTLSFINTDGSWQVKAVALTEDGRKAEVCIEAGSQTADNQERMLSTLESQIGKSTGMFTFRLENVVYEDQVPFMPASAINAVRRSLAESLETMPCISKELQNIRPCIENGKGLPQKAVSYKSNVSNRMSAAVYNSAGAESIEEAYELEHHDGAELMRTKYCIRYELGICPKHHGVKDSGPLFLLNNGQKFTLHFDCRNCEMILRENL
jgi:putative protease